MTVSERPVAVPPVDEPAVGMVVQFGLLAALAAGVGLGPAGWLLGSAYALTTWLLLSHALRRSGRYVLGPANQVTLARATLVGGVAALVADSFRGDTPIAVLVTLATVALALDAVDGQVARRTGSTSALGARFDMEVDAFLILVLSAFVATSLGAWVLAIGALRYVFVVAALVLPWLRAALPPRFSRKTVAALQGIMLVVAVSGILPRPLAIAWVALALAMLVWSFARDVSWLWRARPRPVGREKIQDLPRPAPAAVRS
ncbi:CDP-alcohol phosphatidyltransferase family protein [Plantactinospora alkalitolerans]|nr:CDP-alcohol phosphatidyltransferase family protein [Plantactinospora alkalitolerans]